MICVYTDFMGPFCEPTTNVVSAREVVMTTGSMACAVVIGSWLTPGARIRLNDAECNTCEGDLIALEESPTSDGIYLLVVKLDPLTWQDGPFVLDESRSEGAHQPR